MLIAEKNNKIKTFIMEKTEQLNREYENIFSLDEIKQLIDKYTNSEFEYDTMVSEIESLLNKKVEDYKREKKNKDVNEYIQTVANKLNEKYDNIISSDKVDEFVNTYMDSEKEYEDIKKEIDDLAVKAEKEYKNKIVSDYILEIASDLNKEYPNILSKESTDELIEKYQDSEKEFEDIKKEIDDTTSKLIEDYKSNLERNNKTFVQVKAAYLKIQAIMTTVKIGLYLAGGIVPYFLLNEDSNRLHDDIDTVCSINDMQMLRDVLKKEGLYLPEWDSINYSKDGKDYGFEILVDGVPVGIYPFSYENGHVLQYGYDPYTKECKTKSIEVQELTDYVTSYKSRDGKIYNTLSLEYIKLTKDSTKRQKDLIDSKKIVETNLIKPDVLNRIKMYTVIDNNTPAFDKRSEKEIEIAGDIREKNKAIVLQQQSVIQNDGKKQEIAKQKVLVRNNNGNSGFTNALTLALIVGFFAGIVCTLMYVFISKV